MNGYLYTIFAILPFTVSLVWLAVYVADYRTSHKPRRFLTYWALICTVLYLCHGRYFVEDGRVDFIMDCIYLFCNLSVYPLFYCYLLILTKDEPVALRAFLYQIPALIVAVATYLSHGVPLAIHIARVLFALEVIMCAVFGLRTLAQFDKEIKNYYSDTEGKTMTGISVQLVFLVIVAILSFLANLIGRPAFVRTPLIIIPSLAFSSRVISVFRPGADSAKDSAASTFGSMEPGANSPSAIYFRASAAVRLSRSCWSGLPKWMATFSTAVRIISRSASSWPTCWNALWDRPCSPKSEGAGLPLLRFCFKCVAYGVKFLL